MQTAVDADVRLYDEVRDFLHHEAELLDGGRLEDWLANVDHEIRYVVPIRVTRLRGEGSDIVTAMTHLDDDYPALKMRVLRLGTDYAWAENPPSRTRHFVSNIRVQPPGAEQADAASHEIQVKSNLLLYRSRSDDPRFDLLSAERHDVFRRADGRLKLLRRTVLLDQSTLATHNLAILF